MPGCIFTRYCIGPTLILFHAILPIKADVFNMSAGQTSLQFVTVDNVGNPSDTVTGSGSVSHVYRMGEFEVTAGQYTEFLNAVARTDTYGLYSASMDYDANTAARGCNIKRGGDPGSYNYNVNLSWANRPVNYISWSSAARFANWLTNGQPVGPQGLSTTEDGSYSLNGKTGDPGFQVLGRNGGARYVLPNRDEWYKTAYYDPAKPSGSGYWAFPTRNNAIPSNMLAPAGTNNANYYSSGVTLGCAYLRTEVGQFAGSPGPYGTFDQAGNVSEYTENIALGAFFHESRGGSYSDPASSMQSLGIDNSSDLSAHGFRIAYVPEPATLALFALAAAVVSCRRSRQRFD